MTIDQTDEELLEAMLARAEEFLEVKNFLNSDSNLYEMAIEEHDRLVDEMEAAVEGWLSGEWDEAAFNEVYDATTDALHTQVPEGFYSEDEEIQRRARISYLRRISVEEDEGAVADASAYLERGWGRGLLAEPHKLPGADDPVIMRRYVALLCHVFFAQNEHEEYRSYTPFGWRPSDLVPT